MKVLGQPDGFPPLAPVQIGIMKRPGLSTSLTNAITAHISACLDNITPPSVEDDMREINVFPRTGRVRAPAMQPGW